MADARRVELDGGKHVTAVHYPAGAQVSAATLVLGHGAGAGQTSEFMVDFATSLASHGLDVITFNFPFTEQGRRLPDPQPVLESCYRTVLAHVAADPVLGAKPLFIGGKSLGGRISSHVAAAPDADQADAPPWGPRLRGLVFFGYPLHPPGKPQQLRVSHLPRVTVPMLFVQGSKDAFGTPDELRAFTDVLPSQCTLQIVEGGDHSYTVLKRWPVPQVVVYERAVTAAVSWIRRRAAAPPDGSQMADPDGLR
jgi:predicted alpha/beta-hydrolase family hydrolase